MEDKLELCDDVIEELEAAYDRGATPAELEAIVQSAHTTMEDSTNDEYEEEPERFYSAYQWNRIREWIVQDTITRFPPAMDAGKILRDYYASRKRQLELFCECTYCIKGEFEHCVRIPQK